MIREEEPFVVSRPEAAEALCAAARAIGQLKVDGLVLGFLDSSGAVDEALLGRVLSVAPHVAVTFHRAFEEVADAAAAFASLQRWKRSIACW